MERQSFVWRLPKRIILSPLGTLLPHYWGERTAVWLPLVSMHNAFSFISQAVNSRKHQSQAVQAHFFKNITIIRSSSFNLGTQKPCGLLDLAMYHRLIAPKGPRSLRIVLLVVLGPQFSHIRVSLSPRSLFRIV